MVAWPIYGIQPSLWTCCCRQVHNASVRANIGLASGENGGQLVERSLSYQIDRRVSHVLDYGVAAIVCPADQYDGRAEVVVQRIGNRRKFLWLPTPCRAVAATA